MNYYYAIVVFVFIVCDYLTGILKAIKKGKWKSNVMKQGLISKFGELFALVVMYLIEYLLPLIEIHLNIPFVQALSIYLIIMELGSIVENLGQINPNIADKLKNIFEDFKKIEGNE